MNQASVCYSSQWISLSLLHLSSTLNSIPYFLLGMTYFPNLSRVVRLSKLGHWGLLGIFFKYKLKKDFFSSGGEAERCRCSDSSLIEDAGRRERSQFAEESRGKTSPKANLSSSSHPQE